MAHRPSPGYRSVVYYTNWSIYARAFPPHYMLFPERFTHILYAFANVRKETGEVIMTDTWADVDIHYDGDSWNDTGTNLYGCLKQLHLLKKRNTNLKLLLSIGGWTFSENFRGAGSVMTAAGRTAFVRSAVALVQQLGFDGLDIDWEYPQNAAEAASYVELLAACRKALDAYSATLPAAFHFELTVACPAGADKFEILDVAGMDRYLDFWNLMAYDYAGSWTPVAAHQANLYAHPGAPATTPYNTAAAVRGYCTRGVAPHKLVLGMPLYGRAFDATDGPGQPASASTEGTWEPGVIDFKRLPLAGAQEVYDHAVGTSYCYNAAERRMVSYDTSEAAEQKAQFIRDNGLGGAMWWEVSADKEGPASLVRTVVEALGGERALQQKPACTTYPVSKYDNLRAGFPGQP